MVKTQLRGVRIEGDTPLNASPGQPQICLDFLLGRSLKREVPWFGWQQPRGEPRRMHRARGVRRGLGQF